MPLEGQTATIGGSKSPKNGSKYSTSSSGWKPSIFTLSKRRRKSRKSPEPAEENFSTEWNFSTEGNNSPPKLSPSKAEKNSFSRGESISTSSSYEGHTGRKSKSPKPTEGNKSPQKWTKKSPSKRGKSSFSRGGSLSTSSSYEGQTDRQSTSDSVFSGLVNSACRIDDETMSHDGEMSIDSGCFADSQSLSICNSAKIDHAMSLLPRIRDERTPSKLDRRTPSKMDRSDINCDSDDDTSTVTTCTESVADLYSNGSLYSNHKRRSTSSKMYSVSSDWPKRKRSKLRKVSETIIPSCVLIPSRSPVAELYRLFPLLPPGQSPINVVTCALHKDILLQGRLFICQDFICFYSNIFGYETRVPIDYKSIVSIRREKTVFVVPNAISVVSKNKRYFFCSFLSRETVFRLLDQLWRGLHQTMSDDDLFRKHGRDLNDNIKMRTPKKHKYREQDSISSNYIKTDMPDRPHTSPPRLFHCMSEVSLTLLQPRTLAEGIVSLTTEAVVANRFKLRHTYLSNSYLQPTEENDPRGMNRAATLSDLRYLHTIENRINKCDNADGYSPHIDAFVEKDVTCLQRLQAFIFWGLGWFCSLILMLLNRVRLKNTATTFVFIVFFVLFVISVLLAIRVNNLTASFEESRINGNTPRTVAQPPHLQHLMNYRDEIHNAEVQRVRTILSANLEAVYEVQEALKELKDKLKK